MSGEGTHKRQAGRKAEEAELAAAVLLDERRWNTKEAGRQVSGGGGFRGGGVVTSGGEGGPACRCHLRSTPVSPRSAPVPFVLIDGRPRV